MAALERLAHGVHVADALEREIGPTAREVDDRLHDLVATDLVRVDEMGHAELLGDGALVRIEVDADDLVGADHAGALDDVEADAAEPNTATLAPGQTFAV